LPEESGSEDVYGDLAENFPTFEAGLARLAQLEPELGIKSWSTSF
jgi:hypothetical protein